MGKGDLLLRSGPHEAENRLVGPQNCARRSCTGRQLAAAAVLLLVVVVRWCGNSRFACPLRFRATLRLVLRRRDGCMLR